jgi:hypothetical protein
LVAGPSRWFEYAALAHARASDVVNDAVEDGLSEVGIADDFAPAADHRRWLVIRSEAADSV